ncbi:MAG: hypothetical protein RLZZ466_741, partial [Bacteroidota bacterium]
MNALLVSALLGVLLLFGSVFVKNRSINYYIALVGSAVLFLLNVAELKGMQLFNLNLGGLFHFD